MAFVEVTSPRYFLERTAQKIKESKKNKAVIVMLKIAGSFLDDLVASMKPRERPHSVRPTAVCDLIYGAGSIALPPVY